MAKRKTDIQRINGIIDCTACQVNPAVHDMIQLLRRERRKARRELLAKLDALDAKTDRQKVKDAFGGWVGSMTQRHTIWLLRNERARVRRLVKIQYVTRRKTQKSKRTVGRLLEL